MTSPFTLGSRTDAFASLPNKHRRYRRRLRLWLVRSRGGKCRSCSSKTALQFAHRRPTGLQGMGRGSRDRYSDVRKFPRRYVLLCVRCHRLYDRGLLLPASHKGGWRCVLTSLARRVVEEVRAFVYGSDVGLRINPLSSNVTPEVAP